MAQAAFTDWLAHTPCILGEGSLIERLRRASGPELDPFVVNSGFIYSAEGRAALAAIYRQYLEIGRSFDLPLVLSTPTWRAGRERIAAAGLADRDVNADNVRFLDELRREQGDYAAKVKICGLLSCRGDAYRPGEALNAAEAESFHAWQAERLARAGVDFLLAATLPALTEAAGLAAALAATGVPYLVSFVVRKAGTLLDGTPLKQAIAAIDAAVSPQPAAYLVNCSHASIFRAALDHAGNSSPLVRGRIIGLFANTAALEPEQLDNSAELIEEEPERFAAGLAALRDHFGLKLLGGCCGTDDRHIRALAARLAG